MESLWEGLTRRPADPVMFTRLRERLQEREDWSGLTRLYHQRADAVGGEEALLLYLTVAECWAARSGDQEGVRRAVRRAMELSDALGADGQGHVHESLKELFWARGDWHGMAELLAREARNAPPGEERARRWIDLAELRLAKLGELGGAAQAWAAAAQEPGAPVREIRRRLQEMWGRHPEQEALFEVLRDVYMQSLDGPQDAAALQDLLMGRLRALGPQGEPQARGALLLEIGRLSAEHLVDAPLALEQLGQARALGVRADKIVAPLERLLGRAGEDVALLGMLRALYRELGRWSSLVEVGQREARLLREPQAAAVLWELALVTEEELGELERACALYERAVTLDPARAEAAATRLRAALERQPGAADALALLKELYRRRGDEEALLELLEAEEGREHDQDRRAALLLEMASLCAEGARRPDRALEYYEAAADLASDDALDRIIQGLLGLHRQGYYLEEVEALVRRICSGRERWGALIHLLEFLIEGAPDDLARAGYHAELGELLEHHTDELERAMHHYQRAFKLDTSRHDTIEAGRQLYRRMGNLEMVARLYDIELKVAAGPEEAARLLLQKGRVFAQELHDAARALESLGRACALAPEMEDARAQLEQLVSGPDGREALQVLEGAYLRAGRPAEAAAIHLLVGERLRRRLERDDALPEEDRARLLALANDSDLQAWRIDPTGNARVRAALRLERGLAAQQRWTDLAEVLERRSREEHDPEGRQELWLRLGCVALLRLEDEGLAFDAWQGALEDTPGQLRAFMCMEALYRASEAFTAQEGLDQLIDWALDAAPWASAELALSRRATMLVRQAARLEARQEHRGALELWLRLGELAPNDPRALAWFEARANTPEGAQDLFRLLERGLMLLDDLQDRIARLQRMAALAAGPLRDPLLAIDQHRALLNLEGASPKARADARARLRALFREVERYDALAALLEEELAEEATTGARRAQLLQELVNLHQRDRHDLEATRDALSRAIALQPEDPDLRLHLADVCLAQRDHAAEAAALAALLADRADLRESLGRARDADARPARVGDLLTRLARLQSGPLRDPAAATLTWRRLLNVDPWHEAALDEFQRLLARERDFEALMELLDQQAQRAADTSDKIHFLRRMATLAEHELHDLPRATALWLRALDLRPRDLDALQMLEALYERQQDWPALISTCQERLTITTDRDARAVLLRRIGRVHRQQEQLDLARATFEALLRELPEDILARQALYELHTARGDHEALADTIDDLLRVESDPNRRRALLSELAQRALTDLNDPDRGTAALERLVDEHPRDAASLQRLFDLHASRGHWRKAAAALRQLANLANDSERRLSLLLRLAELLRNEVRDPHAAAAALEEALSLHPANRDALERLENLYLEMDAYEDLVRVRDRLVDLDTDARARVARLRANAQVLESDLGRPAMAFDRLVLVHELDPLDPEPLQELHRLAELADLWRGLLAVLADDAARAPSLEERHRTQRQMATLVEQRLGDLRQAFDIYRDVFLGAPHRGPELDQLERLAEAHGEFWVEVIALYERLIELRAEPDALPQLHWRVAELQRDRLQQPNEAFVTLRHALQLAQGDAEIAEAMTRLRDLAARDALWEDLAEVLQHRAAQAQDPQDRAALLLDSAQILEAQLHDPARALDARADAFRASTDGAVDELLRAQAQRDLTARKRLLTLYEEALAGAPEPAARLPLLGRAASLQESCGALEESFALWLRAFHEAPRDLATCAELERLAALTGQLPQVALAYQDAAEAARREDALPFLLQAARLLEEGLRDPDAATSVLLQALQANPEHEDTWRHLERLYRQRGDLDALITLYQQRADRTVDRERRRALYLSIAGLYVDAQRHEEAVEFYRRTLRLNPNDTEVLQHLATLYSDLGEQDRMARCLEQIAEIAADRDELLLVRTLDQLAALYVEHRRPTRAIEVLERLLPLRPLRRDLFDRLAALLHETGRLEPLISLHEHRVVTLEALIPEIERFHQERAALIVAPEDAPEGALDDAHEPLLVADEPHDAPEISHEEDLALDAEEGFEELILDEVEVVEIPSPPDSPPADPRLVRWADLSGEVPQAEPLRQEIRELFLAITRAALELLRAPRRAVRALTDLLERDPADRAALEHLAALYAQLERWQDHIGVLRRQAALLPADDTARRVDALRHIARVYEGKLYHPDHAVAVLAEIRGFYSGDPALLLDMARLYERLERWDDALQALREAAALRGPLALPREELTALWCRIGELEEKFHRDGDAAFEAYEQALRLDPEDPRARQAVIRHLARGDQWERRVSLLRLEAERAPGGEERAALLREIGLITRDHGDLDRAQEILGQALAEDVRSLEVLRDLADVAWHRQDWEEVVRVLEVLLDGSFPRMAMEAAPLPPARRTGYEADDDPSFVLYLVRQARALEHLGRADAALETYSNALKVRSNHLDALLGAARLTAAAGDADAAQRHLTRIQAAHEAALTPQDRAEVAWRLAQLLVERRLHQRALEVLRDGLLTSPHEGALALALDCALHLHRHDEAAQLLQRLADAAADPGARQRWLMRLGELRMDRLQQPEAALDAWRAALAIAPNPEAAEHALELTVRLERWDEALDHSLALIQRLDDALEADPQSPKDHTWRRHAVRLLLRHAQILHRGLDDPQEAIQTCERALWLDPASLEPLIQIGLLLGQQRRFDELQARYRRFVDALPPQDVALRVEVLRRLGVLLTEELGAHQGALEVFLELRALVPDDLRVHDALAQLYCNDAIDDPEAALQAHRAVVALGEVSEHRFRQILALYRRTGRDEGARILLRLLDFCRCATEQEQEELRQTRGDLPELHRDDLAGAAYLRGLRPPLTRGPLGELMAFASERAAAALPLDALSALEGAECVTDRRNLSVASIFRDCAGALGLAEADLYLQPEGFNGLRVMMSSPPAVMIGEDVSRGLFNKEQRFVLGRALETTRPAFLATATMEPFAFMAFYEAIFSFGLQGELPGDDRLREEISAWRARIEADLDDEGRQTLLRLVHRALRVHQGRPSVLDWRRAVTASALRVGLFLAADPLVAIKRLLREEERLRSPAIRSFDDLAVAMETSRDLREIILFLLGEDFLLAHRLLRGEEIALPDEPWHELPEEPLEPYEQLSFSEPLHEHDQPSSLEDEAAMGDFSIVEEALASVDPAPSLDEPAHAPPPPPADELAAAPDAGVAPQDSDTEEGQEAPPDAAPDATPDAAPDPEEP